jgi:hypothetical protein
MEIHYGPAKILYLSVLLPYFILLCSFVALGMPLAVFPLTAICAFVLLLVINYEIILTEEELRIPIVPKLWYLRVKVKDIAAICKAKDYVEIFKKVHPNKKVLNRPLFGAVVIPKRGLGGRGIGILPENVEKLIADFEKIKRA